MKNFLNGCTLHADFLRVEEELYVFVD